MLAGCTAAERSHGVLRAVVVGYEPAVPLVKADAVCAAYFRIDQRRCGGEEATLYLLNLWHRVKVTGQA